MSDHLTETIASTLAMSYGSHTHAPQGGKDWKAAEDLVPVITAEIRKARAEAIREAVEKDAITTPDILGYKVQAVAVEDLLNRADRMEAENG